MKPANRKPPFVTYTLTAICVAVFAVHLVLFYRGETDLLVTWLAKDNAAIARGEWWRLVSAHFLHTNILHLAISLLLLVPLGRLLEREMGWLKFLGLCILGGAAGAGISYWLTPQRTYGLSATGMGLFGALFLALIRSPDRKRYLVWIGLMLLALFIDNGPILGRFFDIRAHLAGFLAGMVYEWLACRSDFL